jgi:hypothetical protein
MNWIEEANERMRKSIQSKKEAGLTEKTIKRKQPGLEGGIANKGKKHSEETRKVWSDIRKGKKPSEETIAKTTIGQKKTKWLQLLEKYPLQTILDAQSNNDNHQTNTCKELGISFYSYKKLCKHYGIELKKSNYEKTEFARTKQAEPILVWQCSKREPFRPIGKPKEYYSVTFCCNSFEPKLHKGNMLRNMVNGTPYRNMFFKKK